MKIIIYCFLISSFIRIYSMEKEIVYLSNPLIPEFFNAINKSNEICDSENILEQQNNCPHWQERFDKRNHSNKLYMNKVKSYFSKLNGNKEPNCAEFFQKNSNVNELEKQKTSMEVEGMRVETISGELLNELPSDFPLKDVNYTVLPPKNPPKNGEPLKTLVQFIGGPGPSFSDRPQEKIQHEDYQVVYMDYIGMGQNKIDQVIPNVTDKHLDLDTYAILVKEMIKKERKNKNVDKFILTGHSFGTNSATVVASYLNSDLENYPQPEGVVLSGLTPFMTSEKENSQNFQNAPQENNGSVMDDAVMDFYPRKLEDGTICLLPKVLIPEKGPPKFVHCDDENMYKGLEASEKEKIKKKLSEVFKDFDNDNPDKNMYLRIFQEMINYESAEGYERALEVLQKILSDYDKDKTHTKLYCIFKEEFHKIPWYDTGETASRDVSVRALRCQARFEAGCDCFKNEKRYQAANYQITSPMIYVNGLKDNVTPVEWSRNHFNGQVSTKSKEVFDLPEGTHKNLFDPEFNFDQYFEKVFNSQ